MKINQKGIAPIVVVLLVVIFTVAAGTGTYLFQSRFNAQKEPEQINPPYHLKTDGQTVNVDNVSTNDTAGWQTYRSQCGYEIKYPSAYRPNEDGDNVSFVTTATVQCHEHDGSTDTMCDETNSGPNIICAASKDLLHGAASLADYIKQGIDDNAISKSFGQKVVNIASYPAIEVEGLGAGGTYRNIYLQKDDNIIEFNILKEGNESGIKIFDQMLSTFRIVTPEKTDECIALGKEPGPEGSGAGTGFDCKYDIGPGFSGWRFLCPDVNKNIEVSVYDGNNRFVQKITVDDNTAFESGLNLANDINFDGYKDCE